MVPLDSYPFDKLSLPPGETVQWKAHNPTFHRGSDYGIILTDRALYLYSPFWRWFARWRRIPLLQIRGIAFKNSRLFPCLDVTAVTGREVLRTPWDYRDEMDYDRENLRKAAHHVQQALASASRKNGPPILE